MMKPSAWNSGMDPISDARFRQRWEFRDGRSELSSDNDKPEECDSPASELPLPGSDQGKDRSSSFMSKKACKSRVGVTRKAKLAKKKNPDIVNLGGMCSVLDELGVHMRSVLEDLDAERRRMLTWMREEFEKLSGNGAVPRRRGENGVQGRSRTRMSESKGPDVINIGQMLEKNGKQKVAADHMCNRFVRPDGGGDLREISSAGAAAGISSDQSLTYYSPLNGFLDYSDMIPRVGNAGIRPSNSGVGNAAAAAAATHPYTLLMEGVPPAGGQVMENF